MRSSHDPAKRDCPKHKAQSVAERITGIKDCPRFNPILSVYTCSGGHASCKLIAMVSSSLQEQKPSLEQAYACEGAVLEWVQTFFGKHMMLRVKIVQYRFHTRAASATSSV
jgi:hypothetical protein